MVVTFAYATSANITLAARVSIVVAKRPTPVSHAAFAVLFVVFAVPCVVVAAANKTPV